MRIHLLQLAYGDDETPEWEDVTPRLGLTYALGAERKTLLRASYARYTDQLGSSDAGANNPFYDYQVLYYYWTDANADRRVQRLQVEVVHGGGHGGERGAGDRAGAGQ